MSFLVLVTLLLLGCAEASNQCSSQSVADPPGQTPADRLKHVKSVWKQRRPLSAGSMETLRAQAWAMFDHGFSSYMKHAFPKDNLLPVSCSGQDWQGGLGLTLVDSLDMLLLLNRRADIQQAVEQLKHVLNFDKDVKVHVFETTIRVLGGLLSGHVLLAEDPGLVPGYDGLLLRLAADLGDRMLKAFDTPSGLPGAHVHLQKGMLAGENISCTACAGTLLLEFGLLSRLTGKPDYMAAAHHAAQVLFDQRSSLGLVGSGFHVYSRTWSHRDSTIGPGSDSYYEYLLKAYLMFGDRAYLAMFAELYVATMKHMQVPGQLGASSSAFLLDVHMDSGRLLKPWVSSLGAFWPAMQVLAGQNEAAERLHTNFTAAWATWGWLPEVFGADLSAVHPEDPGYNLRPEHIESTWYLKAVSGDPSGYYGGLAGAMMAVLNHSRVACGYAPINNVNTGAHTDLMESYFLSETVKYLYLSFVDSGPLLDYYVLSTEGHIMPAFSHPSDQHVEEDLEQESIHGSSGSSEQEGSSDTVHGASNGGQQSMQQAPADATEEQEIRNYQEDSTGSCASPDPVVVAAADDHGSSINSNGTTGATTALSREQSTAPSNKSIRNSSLVGKPLAKLPANCRALCQVRSVSEEASYERRLRAALPLLPVRRAFSRRIRYRRCVACLHTTEALEANPPDSLAVRLARLNFGHDPSKRHSSSSRSTKELQHQQELLNQVAGRNVLAQVLCILKVYSSRSIGCHSIRRLTALDNAVGLAPGTLLLQLTAVAPEQVIPSSTLLVAVERDHEGPLILPFPAAEASFGPNLPQLPDSCIQHLLQQRPRLSLLHPMCPLYPPGEALAWAHKARRSTDAVKVRWQLQSAEWQQRGPEDPWVASARLQDPWLGMCPAAAKCDQLVDYLTNNKSVEVMYLRQLQAEREDVCMATHQQEGQPSKQVAEPKAAADAVLHAMHYQEAAEATQVCIAALEHHRPLQLLSEADLASPGLRSACAGWSPHNDAGGMWLPAADWGAGGCAELLPSHFTPRMAPLVPADPFDACTSVKNYKSLRGAIAVVARGKCSFTDKAMNVDRVGALAVVVLNLQSAELITMTGDETGRTPDIPAVLVGGEDSKALQRLLQQQPLLATLVALQDGVHQPEQAGQPTAKGKGKPEAASPQQVQSKENIQHSSMKDSSSRKQMTQRGYVQTRVDLFVPGQSQVWLTENVVKAGGDTQALFAEVVRDPRVIAALQAAAYKP